MTKFTRRRFLKLLGFSPIAARLGLELVEDQEHEVTETPESEWERDLSSPYFASGSIASDYAGVTAVWTSHNMSTWECSYCNYEKNPFQQYVCKNCGNHRVTDALRMIWS